MFGTRLFRCHRKLLLRTEPFKGTVTTNGALRLDMLTCSHARIAGRHDLIIVGHGPLYPCLTSSTYTFDNAHGDTTVARHCVDLAEPVYAAHVANRALVLNELAGGIAQLSRKLRARRWNGVDGGKNARIDFSPVHALSTGGNNSPERAIGFAAEIGRRSGR